MLAQGSAISLIIDKQRDAFNKQSKYANSRNSIRKENNSPEKNG